jgi:hypothetical protein
MPRHRDREAADRTDTNRVPKNLEESEQAEQGAEAATRLPGAGIVDAVKETVQNVLHGYCKLCDRPALPDPRGTHVCARCRSEFVPEIVERKARLEAEARRKKLAPPKE